MANQGNILNHNPGILSDAAPSLADRLSEIALHLADLDNLEAVCLMLGRKVGRLGLGVAMILPRFLDQTTGDPVYIAYHLCDPGDPDWTTGQDPSEPFFPDNQATMAGQIRQMPRVASLGQDFANLLDSALPHALVRADDQGILVPLVPHSPEKGLLIVWGEGLRPSDTIPFSALAGMLGLVLKIITSVSRQQYKHQIEQATLLDISRILLQGSDLRTLLGQVAETIKQTTKTELAHIHLFDGDSHCFVPYGAAGWDGGPPIPIPQEPPDVHPNGLSYVYYKKQPIIIDDDRTELRFGSPDFSQKLGIRSVVIVPILVGNREVIGSIACSAIEENSFHEQDVRLLALISSSAAQAIERLRLHQNTQRQVEELSILYQVAQLANNVLDEDELLQQVTDAIREAFYADEFGFMLLNQEGDGLLPHASYHTHSGFDLAEPLALDDRSVNGQVFITQTPQRISDVLQHPGYRAFIPDMRSELCVPLMAHNEILGVINAESRYPDYFLAQDERFLLTISGQIASAILRIRHYAQEHQRSTQSESLRLATSTLASSLDLQEVLTNILEQLDSLLHMDSACIFLKEERGLLAVAAKGFANLDEIVGSYFSADQALYQEIERLGKPVIIQDTRLDRRFAAWANTSQVRSWLGVPMSVRGKVIGYITIDDWGPNAFTTAQADLAQPFANQAAMVIENARLFESERRQLALAQAQQEIGRLLTSELDLSQVLETILEVLNRVVPSDSASIMLVDDEGQVSMSASRNLVITSETIHFTTTSLRDAFAKFGDKDTSLIVDTETDDRWIQLQGSPIRSWVGAVLSIQGKTIGMLNIDSHQPYSFDQSILPIVRTFADQAAVAIYNGRMFDLTQQALNVTEILYTTAHALIETTDLDGVLRIVASQARNAMDADQVTVTLIDVPAQRVIQMTSSANGQIQTDIPDLLDSQTIFDALWRAPEGESLRQRLPHLLASQPGVEGNGRLIVPLVFQESPLGLMVAQNGPHQPEFTQRQLDLLMAIGNQAATAITSMQLVSALETEKDQLELRVTERTQDLARANEQLKELDRLKSEFIANVSHELRTPLTNIKLYLSLLSRTSVESQANHLRVIKEQADQLHQLIETVLDLSHLDASVESETAKNMPVEVGRLIITLVEEARPRAKAKEIRLEILALSNRAYVQGDREQLTQAFEGLIANALKYTQAGGAINLQVRREEGHISVIVEDTGMGIHPQDQPFIFDRFYRSRQATDANIPGTGLGLSIVKKIIDHHKGQIEVVSQLDHGSKFSVRLPSISEVS
ncbi:MAG: GAF domain-containing protein [Caldilineaceae bacterium]|nr:GAF domain-containing protein [Caldilineaceae bacterium]MBP8106261.1 GAF domain-containing protein [Caldilineaceae bacterium]MBP8121192.1 GAF domain-containing protein [Caldilineaceae bacterium]MBP9071585.1 GAF domain-containing protein [Caldilineaceae bacterium]